MPLRSLRSLTLAFLGLLFVVTVAGGIGLYAVTQATIRDLADERILTESNLLAPPGTSVRQADLAKQIDDFSSRRDTGDLGFVLEDSAGHQIAGNVTLSSKLPMGYSSLDVNDQIEGLTQGRALVRDLEGGLRLTIISETEPFDDLNAARRRGYFAVFGAILAVVMLGLVLFYRLITRRIDAMHRTAEAIIGGDFARRVPVFDNGDAFDQQAATLNRMLDRIEELMGQIRNVANDISHELRTPLARLRGQLSRMEQSQAAVPVRAELEAAAREADTLLAMFSAILRIAEIESGSRRAGFAPFDLGRLAQEIGETMAPVASEAGHSLDIAASEGIMLSGDRQLLTQAIINLIENSVRHTPLGARIKLSVVHADEHAVLTVEDDGPGISPERYERVTSRFGRLEESRSSPGHGLGLPLVAAIARLHGGTMALGDAAPGLRVTITLPYGVS